MARIFADTPSFKKRAPAAGPEGRKLLAGGEASVASATTGIVPNTNAPRRRRENLRGFQRLAEIISLLALLTSANLHAAQLAVRVQTNTPAEINLPWPYDDRALQEPRGYNHHGVQSRHILRQLIVENPGPKPLTSGEVLVDGKFPGADLPTRTDSPGALFTAWTHARSHAASGLKAAQNPWHMLRFWGYTLCGEDTKALSTLLAARGIEGRSVPLNGHVAGEYKFGGGWIVMDGDQNIVYLNLDNTTLASYAELRADPFLALRTKPFGRFAQPSLAASQFNTGLFEYIDPTEPKPLKQKASREAAPPVSLTIYPGERLIYHYDRSPETPVGDPKAPEWKRAAPSALRLVELQVVPKARGWKKGPLQVQANFPIVAAQNLTTGERAAVPLTELTFSCFVPVTTETDRVSVWMQRAQVSLPVLHAGPNKLELQNAPPTGATVRCIYDLENLPAQPVPPEVDVAPSFQNTDAVFPIKTQSDCDRIWWQIADEPRFQFVAPNLDQVEKATRAVKLDALTSTFLNSGTDYYFRVKTVRQGAWSEWSEPRKFRVEKPSAPTELTASAAPDGQVRLHWKGAGEFVVFASNRLDFLPDAYAGEQITTMRGLAVQAKRPNQNRVVEVDTNSLTFTPTGRYLRILARRGGVWSNPSALLTLPDELCRNLPPRVVFQVRWTRMEDADPPDVYLGEERPLKP